MNLSQYILGDIPENANGKKIGEGATDRHDICEYLHGEKAEKSLSVHAVKVKEFQCAGCKSIWNDSIHIVAYKIQNIDLCFCLNCEDWIKNKPAVLEQGWTLFDKAGYLRQDV